MKYFGDIAFTDAVKAHQDKHGSRELYAGMTARAARDGLGPPEKAFIEARDSFYMATVNSDGWPYVQHRGGPAGFLKVLTPTRIGFADYNGNRQYVSVGNLDGDDRVSLFLMDYPNRARLKILGHAKVEEAGKDPDLARTLAIEGEGPVERLFTIEIEAIDWNCPKYITPRFTLEALKDELAPIQTELNMLREENAFLKEEVARLLKASS